MRPPRKKPRDKRSWRYRATSTTVRVQQAPNGRRGGPAARRRHIFVRIVVVVYYLKQATHDIAHGTPQV